MSCNLGVIFLFSELFGPAGHLLQNRRILCDIIQNPVYLRHMADDVQPCSLYTITSISWATARLRDDRLDLVKVI